MPASGPFRGMEVSAIVAQIARAVEANRVDLFLQPIVTLPQRKVRYYEALARLRNDDGSLISPDDFLGPAEGSGLMPAIDNLMVFRAVQVVRRLSTKNREVGLFCNMSSSTLANGIVFQEIADFLGANRVLAPYLVFEFSQSAVRAMGPIEHECLATLAEQGFRFSMDHMTDLRVEPRELADHGFRFIKVPATLLLSRAAASGDIHPADFSDLLGRFGIDLIAERIEGEAHRGGSARLRRALRPGLPVLAAAAGARRGAAGIGRAAGGACARGSAGAQCRAAGAAEGGP